MISKIQNYSPNFCGKFSIGKNRDGKKVIADRISLMPSKTIQDEVTDKLNGLKEFCEESTKNDSISGYIDFYPIAKRINKQTAYVEKYDRVWIKPNYKDKDGYAVTITMKDKKGNNIEATAQEWETEQTGIESHLKSIQNLFSSSTQIFTQKLQEMRNNRESTPKSILNKLS